MKLRAFLLANMARVIESHELQAAAGGAVQYSRRVRALREKCRGVRALREKEGWEILTHNDSTELKPGQYWVSPPPPDKSAIKFAGGISAKLRALEKPTSMWLLSQVRRAGQDEQRAVLDWLAKKFGG